MKKELYCLRKTFIKMPFHIRLLRLCGIMLLGVCALGVAGITWAYLIEPNLLFVRKTDISIPQWNGQGRPLRAVIAGDMHFTPSRFDETRAQRYVQRIMALKPDLILLVGDYARGANTNGSMNPQTLGPILRGLKAPCGVFATQGNHDHTFGWQAWRKAFTEAGIRVLDNSSALITLQDGRRLQISGVMDSTCLSKNFLPKRQSPDIPHLLLCHRPEIDRILSTSDFDAVISGHTHGGQICLPLNLLWFHTRPGHDEFYTYPWHTSGGHKYLITKGLGTSTVPFRFNCPPEIYLLKLH